jgi:quinolinate synthase
MISSIAERIRSLCRSRNAVILAHNYTLPEVQDLADFVGDSLELSLRAAETRAEVIVFCGVHFMAETAKILNPRSLVLMPDLRAGCPMADMVNVEALRRARAEHPGCVVVSYVNTTAAVKAESDICSTSANAAAVVSGIPAERPILFLPDRNLGSWASRAAGRELLLWNGYCPTHQRIRPEFIREARARHPDALVVAHPECPEPVRLLADHIASTSGILSFCRKSDRREFIIATELGILHRLRRENPDKSFMEASPHMTCPNMKLASAEKIMWCLEDLSGEVKVDEETASRARRAIERMIAATSASGRSSLPENHAVGLR